MVEVIITDETNIAELTGEILDAVKDVVELCEKLENLDFENEVSVTFVQDEDIKQLNKEYRQIDRPTDVLSFPMYEVQDIKKQKEIKTPYLRSLGDIVISVDTAKRQAKEYGHSLKREIAYLTCHSMYHLMGYDHMDEKEKKIMREKEKNTMGKLDIKRIL